MRAIYSAAPVAPPANPWTPTVKQNEEIMNETQKQPTLAAEDNDAKAHREAYVQEALQIARAIELDPLHNRDARIQTLAMLLVSLDAGHDLLVLDALRRIPRGTRGLIAAELAVQLEDRYPSRQPEYPGDANKIRVRMMWPTEPLAPTPPDSLGFAGDLLDPSRGTPLGDARFAEEKKNDSDQ